MHPLLDCHNGQWVQTFFNFVKDMHPIKHYKPCFILVKDKHALLDRHWVQTWFRLVKDTHSVLNGYIGHRVPSVRFKCYTSSSRINL